MGGGAVNQRFRQPQASARSEVLGFDKPPYSAPADDTEEEFDTPGKVVQTGSSTTTRPSRCRVAWAQVMGCIAAGEDGPQGIARLTDALGAKTRFQAGYILGSRYETRESG